MPASPPDPSSAAARKRIAALGRFALALAIVAGSVIVYQLDSTSYREDAQALIRVRLTCTGELFMCLGQEDMADLRAPLRDFPGDEQALHEAIRATIARKPKGHDFDYSRQRLDGQMTRHMSHTGG